MKTSNELTKWALNAYNKSWRYWYGTVGYNCTQSLYERKRKQYPGHYTSSRAAQYAKDIANARMCCDCVGLIKSFMWDNDGVSKYQSNDCPDKSANGMFEYAKKQGMDWGTIKTIPEIPGLGVRYDGHVGVYIGDGWVIEARGFAYGLVKTKLTERKWSHWYKFPFVDYGAETLTLRKGATGDNVKVLQNLLILAGYVLPKYGADGDFGAETETALKRWQTDNNMTADGTATQSVLDALGAYKRVIVTGSRVNVRAGAGTEYGVLGVVNKGDTFAYVGISGDWYEIIVNRVACWISGKYASCV